MAGGFEDINTYRGEPNAGVDGRQELRGRCVQAWLPGDAVGGDAAQWCIRPLLFPVYYLATWTRWCCTASRQWNK